MLSSVSSLIVILFTSTLFWWFIFYYVAASLNIKACFVFCRFLFEISLTMTNCFCGMVDRWKTLMLILCRVFYKMIFFSRIGTFKFTTTSKLVLIVTGTRITWRANILKEFLRLFSMLKNHSFFIEYIWFDLLFIFIINIYISLHFHPIFSFCLYGSLF